ncbi:Formin-like protein 17 [Hibiscus syriacus]|uniref:Formin-like protein 17 n=1 Tax=Hibiscus syriacus TaxID=106335 RepID=A0A6A2XVQ5_HIBSY|nr:Formin-like protein 17 [Hibiscus syriacus]
MEAFAKVQEIFSNGDWPSPSTDVANTLQHMPSGIQEKMEKSKSQLLDHSISCTGSEKASTSDENASRKKFVSQEIQVAPQKSAQSYLRSPSDPIKGKTELQLQAAPQGAEHCETSTEPSEEANATRRRSKFGFLKLPYNILHIQTNHGCKFTFYWDYFTEPSWYTTYHKAPLSSLSVESSAIEKSASTPSSACHTSSLPPTGAKKSSQSSRPPAHPRLPLRVHLQIPQTPPPPPPPLTSQSSVPLPPPGPGPPVPPPPVPMGLSRANSVSNGNIPSIPGPPPGAPLMRGRSIARLVNEGPTRKLMGRGTRPEEAAKAPEFDMSELESLFSAISPTANSRNKPGKSNSNASGRKPDKVQLSAILALDDTALDPDQIENLIKFCPTKEEIELLKGYTGDRENLGKCEQFFLELMTVPRVESKLRVFLFKIHFYSQVSDLRNSLDIVNSAVRNSVKLKRIMQTTFSGNALNQGTARVSDLTEEVLSQKLPELIDFPKDLVTLEAATKVQLKYLADETQAISKGLEKVVQELAASEKDGPVSETFCKCLLGTPQPWLS